MGRITSKQQAITSDRMINPTETDIRVTGFQRNSLNENEYMASSTMAATTASWIESMR